MHNDHCNVLRTGIGRPAYQSILFLIATIFVMVMGSSAGADPTSALGEEAVGVFGEGSSGHGEPDKTGAMTYSYPFDLPAARGRPQPRLTLTYSSTAGDREAGYGWGLDLPVIERKPLSGNPCFTPEGIPVTCTTEHTNPVRDERFTFNGQPLVFICQLKKDEDVQKNCGEEKQPEWARADGGWRYFRLQVDGLFARFYLSENRRYWRVQLKGGDVLDFGEPPDLPGPGVEHLRDNENAIVRWRLVRHVDMVHTDSSPLLPRRVKQPLNYVLYRWKPRGTRGLLYLTDIYDTPRADGKTDDLNFAHHTQLSWEAHNFQQTSYAGVYKATPDLRLTRVTVTSMPWSGIGPREIIRTYWLSYDPNLGIKSAASKKAPLLHHSFLFGIVMGGRCNQFEDEKGDILLNLSCSSLSEARSNSSPILPPTTFEYQSSSPGPVFGVASLTKVDVSPPVLWTIQKENSVLPYIQSVGVVDFNRDGLSDIVQGWNSQFCPGEADDEDALHETLVVGASNSEFRESAPNDLECVFKTPDGQTNRPIMSARPIIGYLNKGSGNFSYQCMDAGVISDGNGLTNHNNGRAPSFLSDKGATTLVGSWSQGVVAWSNAQFASFRARPEHPSDQQSGEFNPGTGCDADLLKPDTSTVFKPGWKWEKIPNKDWAKPALDGTVQSTPLPYPAPRGRGKYPAFAGSWYLDIDGDGLVDSLGGNGQAAFDFEPAFIHFTRRYARGESLPGGNDESTGYVPPAQIPFVYEDSGEISLVPTSNSPLKLTPCLLSSPDPSPLVGRRLTPGAGACIINTRYFYVDINGDSLVDLVTYNPLDGSGFARVRPGDGQGHFACDISKQQWPCLPSDGNATSAYAIELIGPANSGNILYEEIYFHDVTGDGLADLVKYDMSKGNVSLWVNQDGHTFGCVTESCVVGRVQNLERGDEKSTDIGEHRTTFADMNADGTDDIVILAKPGAYVGLFMETLAPSLRTGEKGIAPRPGLLTRIHNGFGATNDIQYHTIQELDLKAREEKHPWRHHSPAVASVVTKIVTQDSAAAVENKSLPQPYHFKRQVQYAYQDPAYDRWERRFTGFRQVFTRYGDEQAATVTTYWFGPCHNDSLEPLSDAATADFDKKNATKPPLCWEGSDDDPYKSLAGRVARIDRVGLGVFPELYDLRPSGMGYLWTKTFHYTIHSSAGFANPGGVDKKSLEYGTLPPEDIRRVSFVTPAEIDTYLYDETKPTTKSGELKIIAGADLPGGDVLKDADYQDGIRKHLHRAFEFDAHGNLVKATDEGNVTIDPKNFGNDSDTTTITLFSSREPNSQGPDGSPTPPLACNTNWQCLPNYISVWEPVRSGNISVATSGATNRLLRKQHFTYNEAGDVRSVEGWLDPVESLKRNPTQATGITVAPHPDIQWVTTGWHTLSTFTHDAIGNIVQAESALSKSSGKLLSCSTITYDKAYQHLPNVVRSFKEGCTGPALETQSVFDRGFGQPTYTVAPNGAASELRLDPFGRPASIYTPDPDAPPGKKLPILAAVLTYKDRSPLSYVDLQRYDGSKGESTRSVTILNGLGEPVLNFDQDDMSGVLSGWSETNLSGQIKSVQRPWVFNNDPIDTAQKAKPITLPSDNHSHIDIGYDAFGRQSFVWESGRDNGNSWSVQQSKQTYFPLALETRDAEQLKAGGPHEKAFQRAEFDGHGRVKRTVQHQNYPTGNKIVTTVQYQPTGEPATVTRTDAGGKTYQRTLTYDTFGRLVHNAEPNTGDWRYVWDDAGRLVGTSDARGCGKNLYYDGLGRITGEDYSPCLASHPPYSAPNPATGDGFEILYRYDAYESDQVNPEPGFTADDPRNAVGNLVAVLDRGSHTRFNYDARGRIRRFARQIAKPQSAGGAPYAPHWYTARNDYDLGDRLTRRTTGVDIPDLLMNGTSEERYAYSARGLLFSIDSSYGPIIKSAFYGPDGAPNSITYGDYYGTRATFEYDARRRLTRYDLTNTQSYPPLWLQPITYFDYRF